MSFLLFRLVRLYFLVQGLPGYGGNKQLAQNPEMSGRGGQCAWGACELPPAGLTAGGSSRSDKKSIKIIELYLGV